MNKFEVTRIEPLSFIGFRRCILSASKADKENWYFSQTRGGYYADYRPDYPRKTSADFYIYLDNSVYPARLTMYQDTATIPTVKQYSGMDALQEDLKNMEIKEATQ